MSRIEYDLLNIKAFVFDVDGVLSPSTISINSSGRPQRMVNIKDGYAIQLARKLKYPIAIITGAKSDAIKARYSTLGVEHIYTNTPFKLNVLKKWVKEMKLDPEQVLYMGDDIPDFECMNYVGLPCCPYDAAIDICNTAKYISPILGGNGCARDVIEQVLRAQGNWMHGIHHLSV